MTIEQIKDIACKRFKITKHQLEHGGRKIECVYAKLAIAKYLLDNGTRQVDIANILGMHHSTISCYFKTFDDRLKYDSVFRCGYEEFIKECN